MGYSLKIKAHPPSSSDYRHWNGLANSRHGREAVAEYTVCLSIFGDNRLMEKRKKSKQKAAAPASSKRKWNSESSFYTLQLQQADANSIFALLIAALSNLRKPKSLFLVRKCLNQICCSLYSETSFTPILALFPTLLNSK